MALIGIFTAGLVLGWLGAMVSYRMGLGAGSQISQTGTTQRSAPPADAEFAMLKDKGQIDDD